MVSHGLQPQLPIPAGVVIRRGAQQAHVVALAGDDRLKQEFLDFMNRVVAQHDEGREIHVILDNLNTHKPKNDRWLKRHPNVHFHFTPTRASWLNQVEIWFSILAGKALQGASFNSLGELKVRIDTFIETYNETARPFEWTASEVHQKRLKPRFADQ